MNEITIEERTYVYDVGKWDPGNPVAIGCRYFADLKRNLNGRIKMRAVHNGTVVGEIVTYARGGKAHVTSLVSNVRSSSFSPNEMKYELVEATELHFGWDLASYGGGGSAFVQARRDKSQIHVDVLTCASIDKPSLKLDSELGDTLDAELILMSECLKRGTLVVDVPIDLQNLGQMFVKQSEARIQQYWQLIKRPVDHAFRALPPLADRVGYAVARFSNLLCRLSQQEENVQLDIDLLETYPAASLRLVRDSLGRNNNLSYKGSCAEFIGGRWRGQDATEANPRLRTRQQLKNDNLAALVNQWRIVPNEERCVLNDDQFDAIICGVTGCLGEHALFDDELNSEILTRLRLPEPSPFEPTSLPLYAPAGYTLLREIPADLSIDVHIVECPSVDCLLRTARQVVDRCE